MRLVYYLIRKRTKSYFSFGESWKPIVGDFLFALLCFMYASGFIILYRHELTYPDSKISAEGLLQGLLSSLLLMPVILNLFPGFSIKKPLVSAQFPMSRLRVALTDLAAMNLYKTRNAIVVLFVVLLPLFIPQLRMATAPDMILLFLIGILGAENIRNGISWKQYFSVFLSILLLCVTMIIISRYAGSLNIYPGLSGILLLILTAGSMGIYLAGYQTKPQIPATSHDGSVLDLSKNHSSLWLLLKISVRNSSFTLVLVIAFAVKLVIMFCFLFRGYDNLGIVIGKVPFVICLFLPVILFTYIFNNTWGYFYGVALNSMIGPAQSRVQVNTYIRLLLPALVADAFITFLSFKLAGLLDLKIIVIYLLSVLYCLPIGIISSFSRYVPVISALDFTQFRGKTSRLYSFIVLVPAMVIGLAYNDDFVLNIILATVFVSSIVLCSMLTKKMPAYIARLRQNMVIG